MSVFDSDEDFLHRVAVSNFAMLEQVNPLCVQVTPLNTCPFRVSTCDEQVAKEVLIFCTSTQGSELTYGCVRLSGSGLDSCVICSSSVPRFPTKIY
jgi:hypothetical protein